MDDAIPLAAPEEAAAVTEKKVETLTGLAGRKGWRYVGPLLGFFAFAALSAYRQLSGLLASTHLPGQGSYGVGSLANLGFHAPHSSAPHAILATWNLASKTDVHQPERIVDWAMYVDFGLLLLYSALFALWLVKVGGRLQVLSKDEAVIGDHAQRRAQRTAGRGNLATASEFEEARGAVRDLIDRYVQVVVVALWTIPALAVADILENVSTIYLVGPKEDDSWFWPLWAFALVKTVLFVFVAASALIATWALVSFRAEARHRIVSTLSAVRAQLLLVVVFCGLVLFDPTGQASDAVLHWQPNYTQAIAPLLLTLLFAALLAVDARGLLEDTGQKRWPQEAYGLVAPIVLMVSGLALAGAAWGADALWGIGSGLVVLGGIFFVIGLLSLLVHGMDHEEVDQTLAAPALTAVLAMLPPIALGTAIFTAAFSELAYSDLPDYNWLIGVGLGFQLIGWLLYPLLRLAEGEANSPLRWAFRIAAGVAAAIFFVWTIVDPWSFAPAVGTLGIFCGSMVALALGASLLALLSARVQPAQAFLLLRLRRTPVFTLLLVWAIVAGLADRTGSYYDVRTREAASVSKPMASCSHVKLGSKIAERIRCHYLTAPEVLDHWLKRAPAPASQATPPGQKPAIPLVFVASEGGGIRAAYWTAIALRCAFEGLGTSFCPGDSKPRRDLVFAASGVSGGALGLVTYATHLENSPYGTTDWPKKRLERDYAAPLLDWALFVDLPLSFIRRDGGTDRAEVLERAWQQGWGSNGDSSALAEGLYQQWQKDWNKKAGPHLPLLLLNGTRVQDGCRYETSVVLTAVGSGQTGLTPSTVRNPLLGDCRGLRLFERDKYDPTYVPPGNRQTWTLGATTDLAADLCPGEDVRLSTAALLAARFPFVTPSGRLKRRDQCGGGPAANVVDGGYFENSATSTITELWDSLRSVISEHNRTSPTCVVPVLLEIDNHYFAGPGPEPAGRPWESTVPLKTLGKGRDARDAQARQTAALAFGHADFDGWQAGDRRGVVDRFAQIFPRAHPGTEAPLGWTLSEAARKDLDTRLEEDTKPEFGKVERWFSNTLTCKPTRQ